MRKRLMDDIAAERESWLDLEKLAQVEISSEEPTHPIELALTDSGHGWRASRRGEQIIRLLFDQPHALRLIELKFEEHHSKRTQEFVLRWLPDDGESYRDIVRQQFTFSPPDTTTETERYGVNLAGVTAIELKIVPDISHGEANASLRSLRLA